MTRVVLRRNPDGMPVPDDFELQEQPMPEAAEGEVLVRTIYLSLDPYMRGGMSDRARLGHTPRGGIVGQAIASRAEAVKAGAQLHSRRHHRLASSECQPRRPSRKRHGRAVRSHHPHHAVVDPQPRIHITHRKDRPPIVAASERVVRVHPAEATVPGQDGGMGIGLLPLALGRGDYRHLR